MNVLIALIALIVAIPVGSALAIALFKGVIIVSYTLTGV